VNILWNRSTERFWTGRTKNLARSEERQTLRGNCCSGRGEPFRPSGWHSCF